MPKILIFNQQRDLSLSTVSIKRVVGELCVLEQVESDEISIYFVTKKKISLLHDQFFQDPSPTDCITLPLDQEKRAPYHILGEIFICPKVACEYASTHKKVNLYEEITLYIIHAFLHLLGYDDLSPQERKKMRSKERSLLKSLNKSSLSVLPRKKAPPPLLF